MHVPAQGGIEWPKLLNMGSKWAHSTCFRPPNSPKVSWEKHFFDPFLADFWSRVAKMACNGLNKGSFHLFVHPKWSRIIFGKTHLSPIFDPFWVSKQPISKAFCDFGGAKTACNGLKMGPFHLFRHPKWSRIIFGKNTFLTHFLYAKGRKGLSNGPIWDHRWLKNGSKPWFSKNDPTPVVVPKQMNIADFEPLLSRSHPLSGAYLICL